MSSDNNGTSLPLTIQQGRDSIVTVDARTLERGCMARVLASEFVEYEIFEADSAAALSGLAIGRPKLVILRIHPDQQSDEAIARDLDTIRRICSDPFIALVCDDDERSLHYAFRHGCNGYLPASMPLEIAVAALRLVLVGGLYFPHPLRSPDQPAAALEPAQPASAPAIEAPTPSVAKLPCAAAPIFAAPRGAGHALAAIPASLPEDAGASPALGFTPREREVIEALQRGRSNKVIASDLNLSENTVKVHVRHIMRKLRATNRTQAALRSQLLFSAGPSIN